MDLIGPTKNWTLNLLKPLLCQGMRAQGAVAQTSTPLTTYRMRCEEVGTLGNRAALLRQARAVTSKRSFTEAGAAI